VSIQLNDDNDFLPTILSFSYSTSSILAIITDTITQKERKLILACSIPDTMGEANVVASQWRLVERGRIVLFTQGKYEGRLAMIAEIIDHKRVRLDSLMLRIGEDL